MSAPGRQPRLAMVMSLRNEDRFLREHLLYHHAVGVERAYLFLDRCNDESEQIAHSFDWVKVYRLDPDEAPRFTYITDLHCYCMDVALAWARKEGFDWLLTIDADELAFADNLHADPASAQVNELIADASLLPLLAKVPTKILQVKLTTREILPCRQLADKPFYRQSYFHGKEPFRRVFFDLMQQQAESWTGFLGHEQGKSIIRTSANVQGHDSHRWTAKQAFQAEMRPDYSPLPTLESGWHAHYFVTCQEHWLSKTPKHTHQPAHWPCQSPVERPIQSWKEAVQSLPPAALDDYCEKWVLIDEVKLKQAAGQGTVVQDTRIARIVAHLVAQARDSAQPKHDDIAPTIRLSEVRKELSPDGDLDKTTLDFSPAKMLPDQLEGFYPVELFDNSPFRWTQPEASMLVRLRPGTYRLHGKTVPNLATESLAGLKLSLDGRPLDDIKVNPEKNRFTATVYVSEQKCQRLQKLSLVVPRLNAQDHRALGLPIQQLRFQKCRSRLHRVARLLTALLPQRLVRESPHRRAA